MKRVRNAVVTAADAAKVAGQLAVILGIGFVAALWCGFVDVEDVER